MTQPKCELSNQLVLVYCTKTSDFATAVCEGLLHEVLDYGLFQWRRTDCLRRTYDLMAVIDFKLLQ